MGLQSRSPWSLLLGGVLLVVASLWTFATTYSPSDGTPLRTVTGVLAHAGTNWIHHSGKGGSWDAPQVALSLADGQTLHFVSRSRDDVPAAAPLSALQPGMAVQAQVDAAGEIWQLQAGQNDLLTLPATLARHHAYARKQHLVAAFILIMGLGLCGSGGYRLKNESA